MTVPVWMEAARSSGKPAWIGRVAATIRGTSSPSGSVKSPKGLRMIPMVPPAPTTGAVTVLNRPSKSRRKERCKPGMARRRGPSRITQLQCVVARDQSVGWMAAIVRVGGQQRCQLFSGTKVTPCALLTPRTHGCHDPQPAAESFRSWPRRQNRLQIRSCHQSFPPVARPLRLGCHQCGRSPTSHWGRPMR